MKTTTKIYLDPEALKLLKLKVEEAGFIGRGSLSKFMEKIAREDIAFLDSNFKKIFRTLNITIK